MIGDDYITPIGGTGGSDWVWATTSSTTTPTYPVRWATDTSTASSTTAYVYWTATGNNTGDIIWYSQPQRIYQPPSERIYRPAVIRRRTVREHAREVVQRVDAVRSADEVKRRARRLLLSHLTPEQRQTFMERGWFVVEGGRSKQRYRIRDKTVMANIDVLDGDRVTHRLCGHCEPGIPIADQLLAQKVMRGKING